MIKTLKKLGIEAVFNKPIANITLNEQNLKPFSLKIRKATRVFILTTLTQYNAGS
jgi:hypothetical protein